MRVFTFVMRLLKNTRATVMNGIMMKVATANWTWMFSISRKDPSKVMIVMKTSSGSGPLRKFQ